MKPAHAFFQPSEPPPVAPYSVQLALRYSRHFTLSAANRLAWLETLAQVCTRFNWVCHASENASLSPGYACYTTVSRLVKAYEADQKV